MKAANSSKSNEKPFNSPCLMSLRGFLNSFLDFKPIPVHMLPILYMDTKDETCEEWFYTDNSRVIRCMKKTNRSHSSIFDRFSSLSLEQYPANSKNFFADNKKMCYLLKGELRSIVTQQELRKIVKNPPIPSMFQQYIESPLGEDACVRSVFKWIDKERYERSYSLGEFCNVKGENTAISPKWGIELESVSASLLKLINDKISDYEVNNAEFVYVFDKKKRIYLADISYCTFKEKEVIATLGQQSNDERITIRNKYSKLLRQCFHKDYTLVNNNGADSSKNSPTLRKLINSSRSISNSTNIRKYLKCLPSIPPIVPRAKLLYNKLANRTLIKMQKVLSKTAGRADSLSVASGNRAFCESPLEVLIKKKPLGTMLVSPDQISSPEEEVKRNNKRVESIGIQTAQSSPLKHIHEKKIEFRHILHTARDNSSKNSDPKTHHRSQIIKTLSFPSHFKANLLQLTKLKPAESSSNSSENKYNFVAPSARNEEKRASHLSSMLPISSRLKRNKTIVDDSP